MEDLSFQIAVVVKKAGKVLAVANSIKGAVAARISTAVVVSLVMAAL